jgi:recombination protein U
VIDIANRGRVFEELVAATNALYANEGRAIVHKVEVGWKIVGYNPQTQTARKVWPEKKSTVDWHGVLFGGRSIQFETKETNQRSFPIDAAKIPEHQIDHLLDVEAMGGIGFLLMWAAEIDTCWVVKPAVVAQERLKVVRMVRRKFMGRPLEEPEPQFKASLKWEELDQLGRRVPWRVGLPDYLAVVSPRPLD